MNLFQYPSIYLASQSPRRAQLLELIGVPFEIYLPDDVEAAEALELEQLNELPLNYVQRVACLKAQNAAYNLRQHQKLSRPILSADTTVAVDEQILAKPVDECDAERMLKLLSGRVHQVHTAVAILASDSLYQVCVSSDVTFKTLNQLEIDTYIASKEPFGKAGAYAIQGYGATFVSHLTGSYSSVMGLPVFEVAQILAQISAPALQS